MAELTLEQAIKFADELRRQGKLAESEGVYKQILNAAPRHPATLNGLGIVLAEGKRLSEAAEIFQSIVEIDPNFVDAWSNLSLAREETKEIARAIDARRKALEFKPDSAEYWHRLGVCLSKHDELKAGIEALKKSLGLDPFSEGARHDLVFALCRDDQEDAAVEVAFDPLCAKPTGASTVKIIADSMKMHGRLPGHRGLGARSEGRSHKRRSPRPVGDVFDYRGRLRARLAGI